MTAIRVEMQLADGSFTSGMLRAGQSLAQFERQLARTNPAMARIAANGGNIIQTMSRMEGATKGFVATLRDAAIVTGLVSMGISKASAIANGWVGDIIRVNSEMERLRFQMQSMSTAADPIKDAGDNVKYLREQAASMPFSLKTITSSFVKLKASGLDPAGGSLKAIADGIAAFGGSDEQLERVTLGITQMAGKSVIQMEEMRQQIGESMPAAMQIMARSMGVSVAELTKAISTGRVESKAALQQFTDELERAYGGTALRTMQTFSGQMSQLHTNIQNLSTNEGGAGFFDQVKRQLVDINSFLRSDMANTIATSLGQSLSSVVGYLREGVEWLWEYRDSIERLAIGAAAGVVIVALTRGIQNLTAAMMTASLSATTFGVNMRNAFANIALGISGLTNIRTAIIGVQFAAMGMGQALVAGMGFLATIAPWIIGVGLAAWTAAEYFGVFEDKIGNAYEELKKFGAESRAVAQQVTDAYIADLERQAEAERKRVVDQEEMGSVKFDNNGKMVADESIGNLWTLNEKIRKAKEDQVKLVADATRRENENSKAEFERNLEDELAKSQAHYNRVQKERDEQYAVEQATAKEKNLSLKALEEQYRKDSLANQRKLSEDRKKVLEDELVKQKQLIQSGDEDVARLATVAANSLTSKIVAENKVLQSLNGDRFGINYTDNVETQDTKLKKAQQVLQSLQEDIAGLKAEFVGADNAYAVMQERIRQGDFGSIEEGGEAVAELHRQLLAATEQKEALDKLTKGEKKAVEDLEKLKQDALVKQEELNAELSGEKMTATEKYIERLSNGYYDGLGPIEEIRKAIGTVITTIDAQGLSATDLARVMQQTTFGSQTVSKIDGVTAAMLRLANQINGVGTNLNGVNFSNFGSQLNGAMSAFNGANPFANRMSANDAILDLIASKESGGDYNATLDNGRWTNGPQNLTSMTLNQIRELQRSMLTPENIAYHGDGGSSALGRYQIVGKTLQGLMDKLGLTGNELYDPQMQDRLARELITGRQGQGFDGLRAEWEGLKNVSDAQLMAAMNSQKGPTIAKATIPGDSAIVNADPTASILPGYDAEASQARLASINDLVQQRVEKTKELLTEAEKVNALDKDNQSKEAQVALKKAIEEVHAETIAAGEDTEKNGTAVKKWIEAIKTGKLGTNTDPESPAYAKLLADAKALDDLNKKIADSKKNDTAISAELEKFEEKRLELVRKTAEEKKKAADPNYKPDSSEMQALITDLDAYIAKVKEKAGVEFATNAEYKAAIAYKQQMLAQQGQFEGAEIRAKWAEENRAAQQSLMTQSQQRQVAMQQQLAMVDQQAAKMRAAGESEVEITRAVEAKKAAIRAQYAQQNNAFTQQMTQWADAQTALTEGAARWADTAAGGITDVIMGTGTLKDAINSILRDMVNMGVKYMMGQMFQGMKGTGKSAVPGVAPAAGKMGKSQAATAGKGKMSAGLFHTGGIVGGSAPGTKLASQMAFMNAPKFHSGGIVGGKKLHRSEVPIIAQKGEGVFTAEQMSKMGGFQANQQISISAPIQVHGSAGTPEQNTDLARKMQKEIEGTMRGVVADELRRQMRPGNMLSK